MECVRFSASDCIRLHQVQCSPKLNGFHLPHASYLWLITIIADSWMGGFFHFGNVDTEISMTIVSLLILPCGRNLLSESPAWHITGTRTRRHHIKQLQLVRVQWYLSVTVSSRKRRCHSALEPAGRRHQCHEDHGSSATLAITASS